MGRPSDYYKYNWNEKIELIEGWARDGLSNEQIAHNMGINPTTLYDWQEKYNKFAKALKKSKEVADYEVENALHKEATGYYYTEENVSNTGEVVEVRKYARPKVSAQKYWLNNRQRKKWSSIDKHEISGPNGKAIKTETTKKSKLKELDDNELKELKGLVKKLSKEDEKDEK